MWLDKYIKETGILTDYPCFNEEPEYVCKNMKTSDIFLAQHQGKEFNALDIVVKYLAIENYYNFNSYGFELYHKMQMKRVGEDWRERFKALIASVEEHGFNKSSWIKTDVDYSIHDGAHRLALAVYHNIDEVPVKVFNLQVQRRYYGVNWFKENDFTDYEISLILAKYNEIVNSCRKPYYCILWTPARDCFDDILDDINAYDESIRIADVKPYRFTPEELQSFIYKLYATDDIAKYKLDLKYSHLLKSMEHGGWEDGLCQILVLKVIIDYPDFRLKPLSALPQSKVTMSLKRYIRDKYKSRVHDYYYDIIMHLTDNQIQNDDVALILKKINSVNEGGI